VDVLLKRTEKEWAITEINFDANEPKWITWDKKFGVPKTCYRLDDGLRLPR
jgi:hypothetical protein